MSPNNPPRWMRLHAIASGSAHTQTETFTSIREYACFLHYFAPRHDCVDCERSACVLRAKASGMVRDLMRSYSRDEAATDSVAPGLIRSRANSNETLLSWRSYPVPQPLSTRSSVVELPSTGTSPARTTEVARSAAVTAADLLRGFYEAPNAAFKREPLTTVTIQPAQSVDLRARFYSQPNLVNAPTSSPPICLHHPRPRRIERIPWLELRPAAGRIHRQLEPSPSYTPSFCTYTYASPSSRHMPFAPLPGVVVPKVGLPGFQDLSTTVNYRTHTRDLVDEKHDGMLRSVERIARERGRIPPPQPTWPAQGGRKYTSELVDEADEMVVPANPAVTGWLNGIAAALGYADPHSSGPDTSNLPSYPRDFASPAWERSAIDDNNDMYDLLDDEGRFISSMSLAEMGRARYERLVVGTQDVR